MTRDTVRHIARLARLDLSDEQLDLYGAQLGGILDHARDIGALDLSSVQPSLGPLVNVLRDDVPHVSLERDEVLAGAPDVQDHRFRVPPIIGT